MQIVVAGGTGRIGSRVVNRLRDSGHLVVAASPSTGVDTISGKGLPEVLQGVTVVVDVIDSPTTEEARATWFLGTSTAHLLAAEKTAGVAHHVGLSILGADRVSSGYFRAKLAQEARVMASGIPYTIVRSTGFFESIASVYDGVSGDEVVRVPPVPIQPVAADDVASLMAHVALEAPLNAAVEMAGPQELELDDVVRRLQGAGREVVTDPHALHLGAALDYGDRSLLPRLRVAPTRFEDWLCRQPAAGAPPGGVDSRTGVTAAASVRSRR